MPANLPRAWVGHDSFRIVIACSTCGAPAFVRDPQTAAMSGKSWIDCSKPCSPNHYSHLTPEARALCRKHFPPSEAPNA